MTARTLAREANNPKADEVDKHQAIVDAARALFTTQGYEATTMAEVARKSGVAVGTVYLYFKNKNDLLFAVKGDWEDQFLSFLTQPELLAIPHHKRARPLMEACFALCNQHTEVIQLMGLQPEMIGWHDHDEGKVEQAVKAFLDEGVVLGSFRPIDTQVAATLAFGMVEYALKDCFVNGRGKDQQRYIDMLVDTLEHWLLTPQLLADSSNKNS